MISERRSVVAPMLGAFTIWFLHFLLCWVAVEIWPSRWLAHGIAWALTALALSALAWQGLRLRKRTAADERAVWHRRLARGAIALASVAVVFSAVPSLVLRP